MAVVALLAITVFSRTIDDASIINPEEFERLQNTGKNLVFFYKYINRHLGFQLQPPTAVTLLKTDFWPMLNVNRNT